MISEPEKGEQDYWKVKCDNCTLSYHFSEYYPKPIYCQYCGKKL